METEEENLCQDRSSDSYNIFSFNSSTYLGFSFLISAALPLLNVKEMPAVNREMRARPRVRDLSYGYLFYFKILDLC